MRRHNLTTTNALLCLTLLFSSGRADEFIYVGPATGDWLDANNWSSLTPGEIPDDSLDQVYIDLDESRNSLVTLDQRVVIDSLEVDAGDALAFSGLGTLQLDEARIAGRIHLLETPSTTFEVRSYLLIEQSGELALGSATTLAAVTGSTDTTIRPLIENRGRIHGAGSLGRQAVWWNEAIIEANIPGQTLSLTTDANFNFAPLPHGANRGLLRATNGGSLELTTGAPVNGVIDNAGGEIIADIESTVEIGRITVQGGTLRAIGDVTSPGSLTLHGTNLVDVVLEGDIQSFGFSLGGAIENRGTVTKDEGGASTVFGNTTLSGGGLWLMNRPTTFVVSPEMGSGQSPPIFTNEDNTLRGDMLFNLDWGKFVNRGIVETIERSNGVRFRIAAGGITNSGVIRAVSTPVLIEGSGILQNMDDGASGVIEALPGAEVALLGPSIVGGILRAHPADGQTPAGVIRNGSSATLLRDIAIEGHFDSPSSPTRLAGEIENRGLMTGHFELAESGISLKGGGLFEFTQISTNFSSTTLTLENFDNTIRGSGFVASPLKLINHSIVEANGETQDWGNSTVENGGTLQALGQGRLSGVGYVTNSNGLIHAGEESLVVLSGIAGGEVTTEGTGLITIAGSSGGSLPSLYNVRNHGAIRMSSGSSIGGEIVNDGIIELFSTILVAPGVTRLSGEGTVAITGRGSLMRKDPSPAGVYLINEAGHTLSGRVFIDIDVGQLVNRGAMAVNGISSRIEMGSNAAFLQEGLLSTWRSLLTLDLNVFQWSNRGQLLAEDGGVINTLATLTQNAPGAEIHIATGSRIETPAIFNQRGGLVTGGGTFDFGTNIENIFSNSGTFAPGDGTGVTDINGHFQQTEFGTLEIELGGAADGKFDRLSIFGTATLDGALNVSLVDDYVPSVGDSFAIVTTFGGSSPGVSGQFLEQALPPLSEGFSWSLEYGSHSMVLSVVGPPLPGDYNNDGVVNIADYTVWRDHLGSQAMLPNDNTPGVDAGDYAVWKSNFGATTGPAVASPIESIPEPTSILQLTAALLLSIAGRRQRRFICRCSA